MSYRRNNDYCNMMFCSELSHDDFYRHESIADLALSCENNRQKIVNIRTIGILESINGRFFIKDIDSVTENSPKIRVSMIYIKSSLQSSIMPYSVQIFGTLQWKNKAVIIAKIIQVLNTTTAVRLNEVMNSICMKHLAVFKTPE